MNTEDLKTAASQHQVLWQLYGDRRHYEAWQRILAILNQPKEEPKPQKQHHLKGRPSPLRGRKLSPEHIQKLKKPKTEEQKKALRVPKSDTSKMGKYERTEEMRRAAAERARRRKKGREELEKIRASKSGPKNHKYKTYIFGAVHPVYGMFYGDRLELHKRFPKDLPLKELRKLAIGEYGSYKGWRLVQKAKK